ncbi:MAG: carbohydrate kinase family protein [Bacteroidales bacterium]|jgi:sugar/nucleoside kinase (ribokinase family)|nr:carbohydrate kinase family protein [Bacteroidales bacterium]
MKKTDIIALGELNVDLILNDINGLPTVGKEIIAEKMVMTLGSSTAIFAANAATLGAEVAFMGMVGHDDFGAFVKNNLRQKGVETSFISESDNYSTGLTVVLSYKEDRANVTYPGAMNFMGINEINGDAIKNAKHVHISSLFMQEALHRDIVGILKLIKKSGATISLDTQWDPSEKWDLDYRQILPMVDVFMPNETELKALTRTDNIKDAIERIRDYANVAVIKKGSNGSLMLKQNGELKNLPACININVVDTVGAGDSFNAGFIHAFVKGESLEECQEAGNITGAVNTTAAGGTGAFISKDKVSEIACRQFGKILSL